MDAGPAAGQGAQGACGRVRRERERLGVGCARRAFTRAPHLAFSPLSSFSPLGHRRRPRRQARPDSDHRGRRLCEAGHGQDGAAAGAREREGERGRERGRGAHRLRERESGRAPFFSSSPLLTRPPPPPAPLPPLSLPSGLPHAQAEDRGVHGAGPEDAAHPGRGGAPGEALRGWGRASGWGGEACFLSLSLCLSLF